MAKTGTISEYFVTNILTGRERGHLRELLELPFNASPKAIADSANLSALTPEKVFWYIDVIRPELYPTEAMDEALPLSVDPHPLPTRSAKALHKRMAETFTGHDIRMLYVKFGFTPGYESARNRLDTLAAIADKQEWTVKTLQTFLNTRATPTLKALTAS